MLGAQGIIPQDDAVKIIDGLSKVGEEIRDGKFVFSVVDEDIHMAIEKRMTEIVGPAGGRLALKNSFRFSTTKPSCSSTTPPPV